MPKPRKWSETEFYHVVHKGVGGQVLFEHDRARQKYLVILGEELEDSPCTLIAWCLMSNHIHLLVRGALPDISELMRIVGQRYAQYFNFHEGHSGHVFQCPFHSEPVETEEHLLSAVRYIHANPQKAGVCAHDEYPWSSYREYVLGAQLVDPVLVLGLLGGIDGFRRFNGREDDFVSRIYDGIRPTPLTDNEAFALAEKVTSPHAPSQLKALPREERDTLLRALRDAGIGVSQASRITGLGKATVSRAFHP